MKFMFPIVFVSILACCFCIMTACGDDDDDSGDVDVDDDTETDDDSGDDDTASPDDDNDDDVDDDANDDLNDDLDDDADDDVNDDTDDDVDDDTTDMTLIPEGTFWMGCEPEDTYCENDELPRHEVFLSAYFIDIYEVTNAQYVEYLNEYGNDCDYFDCIDPDSYYIYQDYYDVWSVVSGYQNRALTEVSWYGAKSYCESKGKRLPTEAEWEKAAKGAVEHFIYPWGEIWINNAANFDRSNDPFETGEVRTTPVGYYDGSDHGGVYQTTDGRSPYGLHDMAGNVWEWVNDYYDENYYSVSPDANPMGPESFLYHIVRGGGWTSTTVTLRTTMRNYNIPSFTTLDSGFRCVRASHR